MAEKNASKVAGGLARALTLTTQRKKEIGARAAAARWGSPMLHKGNFASDFGIDVECYVLDDATRTAVISQRGMAEAIGFSRRGDRLASFVNSQTMDEYIGRELREKLEKPLLFQASKAAAKSGISDRAHGYDATILIDLCQSVLMAKAAGKLRGERYAKMCTQAQIIIGASAKNGIRNLIYALSGYSPSAEEVIAAFKAYVSEEARKYEQEFPNELYMQWHRLYDIPVHGGRGKPWQFKHLTVRHIYFPLAKSNGKIYDLVKALKAAGEDRRKKLFQFFTDLGTKAFRMHMGRVLEMAESSKNEFEYERKIAVRFGGQQELDLVMPTSPNVSRLLPSLMPPAPEAS